MGKSGSGKKKAKKEKDKRISVGGIKFLPSEVKSLIIERDGRKISVELSDGSKGRIGFK